MSGTPAIMATGWCMTPTPTKKACTSAFPLREFFEHLLEAAELSDQLVVQFLRNRLSLHQGHVDSLDVAAQCSGLTNEVIDLTECFTGHPNRPLDLLVDLSRSLTQLGGATTERLCHDYVPFSGTDELLEALSECGSGVDLELVAGLRHHVTDERLGLSLVDVLEDRNLDVWLGLQVLLRLGGGRLDRATTPFGDLLEVFLRHFDTVDEEHFSSKLLDLHEFLACVWTHG